MTRALGCVTGRFQPVHDQHIDLFRIALGGCEHVIVAVTNPDSAARHREPASAHRHTARANPFTYFERLQLLRSAIRAQGWEERMSIVPFDLRRPELWSQYVPLGAHHYVRAFGEWERQKAEWLAQAGYEVTVIDGDPSNRLSASDLRAQMGCGDTRWRALVPATIVPLVDALLAQRSMDERIGPG